MNSVVFVKADFTGKASACVLSNFIFEITKPSFGCLHDVVSTHIRARLTFRGSHALCILMGAKNTGEKLCSNDSYSRYEF